MNIPLYYRYIHEGTRDELDREDYEELTKQIRFNIYKKVSNLYCNYNCIGVILGHHKGDLQENVFFNLMKGRTLTDLSVIKEQSEIMGVNILRLLLSHPKSDIFDFAHKYKIPYFKNTTPIWSNRGKYRNTIEPYLIETFGEGVLTNLSKISKESDELQHMIKESIIKPYFKTIEIKENEHYLPKTLNQPLTYWKYIIHEWCHRNKLPIISHKLIVLLHEKMYYTFKTIINCSDTLKITVIGDYIIISFKN
jgi:tRNA(Ile)-lysidine synthase TilS/MesJ